MQRGGAGRGRGGGDRGPAAAQGGRSTTDLRVAALLQLCAEEINNNNKVSQTTLAKYQALKRTVKLITNHFNIRWGSVRVLHWSITITSTGGAAETDKRTVRKVFNKCKAVGHWRDSLVFDDAKNIYGIPNDLPDVWTADVEVDGEHFEVKVARAEHGELHYNPADPNPPSMEVQQFLDIGLRHSLISNAECIMFGQRFFHPMLGDEWDMGPGLKGWIGYRQAQKPCQLGLQLVVDITAEAVMPAKNAAVLMAELLGLADPAKATEAVWRPKLGTLRQNFDGLEVVALYGSYKRRRKVAGQNIEFPGVADVPASQEMVENETVPAYFKRMYQKTLQYPHLPCLRMKSNDGRRISIPPELLEATARNKRRALLGPRDQETLRMKSAQKPQDREYFIKQFMNSDLLQKGPLQEHYGLALDAQPIQVDGHILPPPTMLYKNKQTGQPAQKDVGEGGSWFLQATEQLLKPAKLTAVAMTCVGVHVERELIRTILNHFIDTCRSRGLDVAANLADSVRIVPCRHEWGVEKHIQEALSAAQSSFGKPADIILVALKSKDCEEYAQVKYVTDTLLGVPCQCFDIKGAQKLKNDYYQNIALKINQKLPGGINTAIAQGLSPLSLTTAGTKKPFMMVGIDVRHPSKQGAQNGEKSTAAVTASISANLGRWAHAIRSQEARKETVTELYDMMRELLLEFYRANPGTATPGLKPEAIFVFRDGVAEGQFEQVLAEEFNAIRRACLSINPGEEYTPRITFIVVQKRHLTRLMPADTKQADRNGNALPGTVVDTHITRSGQEKNFFLNAHASIQGTNRAVHCYVLKDENGFGRISLQLFTYWSCYVYARCTRSVSYPAPAYYAHLAAYRGHLLRNLTEDVKIHDNLKNTGMFWM